MNTWIKLKQIKDIWRTGFSKNTWCLLGFFLGNLMNRHSKQMLVGDVLKRQVLVGAENRDPVICSTNSLTYLIPTDDQSACKWSVCYGSISMLFPHKKKKKTLKMFLENTPALCFRSVYQLLTVVQTSRATPMPAVSKLKLETKILHRATGHRCVNSYFRSCSRSLALSIVMSEVVAAGMMMMGVRDPLVRINKQTKQKKRKVVLKCTVI